MPIQAVVFDLVDVLFRFDNLAQRQAYGQLHGIAVNAIEHALLYSPLFREAVAGRATPEELWHDVTLRLHLDASEGKRVATTFYSAISLNRELVEFIQTLRPHYKTAILTNAPLDIRQVTQRFHLEEKVDTIIISAEERYMKPQPQIFRIVASRLDVELHDVLFIDDDGRYVQAARQVGMSAIQFKNTQQVIQDIQLYLGQSNG